MTWQMELREAIEHHDISLHPISGWGDVNMR
eukprot:CAMPEP_0115303172 /NCGR_PEP_ID=MMETSP0270-20121206/70777_1 /TAXON_ID=71861 /ORGANISM="Scrippsiella trochoidea, Strain CCMP3099" /LENGTH=30 /DNA_ID= /DNA_START= /DNA_END= /DNA_ORIENTATION=